MYRYYLLVTAFSIALIVGAFGLADGGGRDPQKKESPVEKEWKAFRAKSIKHWEKMFGKIPSLSQNEDTFLLFCHVFVQPPKEFKDLGDNVYKGWRRSDHWFQQFLRKPPQSVENRQPKYWLAKNRWEGSVLLHEFGNKGVPFEVQESGTAMLFRISGLNHPGKAVPKQTMEFVLTKSFKLDADDVNSFSLPEMLEPGAIYTNIPEGKKVYDQLSSWKNSVVAFVSDRDICVICYKRDPPGMMMELFNPDDYWVNRMIYKKDAKTLLSPPPIER